MTAVTQSRDVWIEPPWSRDTVQKKSSCCEDETEFQKKRKMKRKLLNVSVWNWITQIGDCRTDGMKLTTSEWHTERLWRHDVMQLVTSYFVDVTSFPCHSSHWQTTFCCFLEFSTTNVVKKLISPGNVFRLDNWTAQHFPWSEELMSKNGRASEV